MGVFARSCGFYNTLLRYCCGEHRQPVTTTRPRYNKKTKKKNDASRRRASICSPRMHSRRGIISQVPPEISCDTFVRQVDYPSISMASCELLCCLVNVFAGFLCSVDVILLARSIQISPHFHTCSSLQTSITHSGYNCCRVGEFTRDH